MRSGLTCITMASILVAPSGIAAASPPPEKVVLDPGYFGAVTLDHAAHLERGAPCKACHGSGPATKLGRIAPGRAHAACQGCHEEMASGPTECRGCHAARPSVEPAVAAAPPGGTGAASGASPPAEAPAAGAGAESAGHGAGAPAPRSPGSGAELASAASAGGGRAAAEPPDPLALRSTIHAGVSMVAGGGGKLRPGFGAGITLRQDGLVAAQVIEWSAGERQRTLGLLGGGVVVPVRGRLTGQVLGVAGIDVSEGSLATVVPTAGARAVLELGGVRWLRTLQLSVTGTADVTRHRVRPGSEARGYALSACLGSSIDRPP